MLPLNLFFEVSMAFLESPILTIRGSSSKLFLAIAWSIVTIASSSVILEVIRSAAVLAFSWLLAKTAAIA